MAEVAARVGMVDVAYFSRLFKKKYGLSPLRYRARPAEG
ncbi:helix-turn-helix domain-containing protein [Alistipes finegoldii]